MIGGFQVGPFQPAYQQEGSPPTPTPQSTGLSGGGGGVSKWPGRKEFGWEKWRRLEDKKLAKKRAAAEKSVEKIEKQVQEKRLAIDTSRDLEAIQSLYKQLSALERRLEKARALRDELEMQEVLMVWMLTR
jgi:hypothetical protein